MNREHPSIMLEHYMVRAVMALSNAAAKVGVDDLRDDLRDSAAVLVRLAISSVSEEELREWCDRTVMLLDGISPTELPTLSSVQLSVIRVRSSLPKQPASPPRPAIATKPAASRPLKEFLSDNQKKIIEFMRTNPEVRIRELMAALLSSMSERTIKRSLKELTTKGTLKRIQDADGVRYCLAEDSAS
jgi:hypothetical protein